MLLRFVLIGMTLLVFNPFARAQNVGIGVANPTEKLGVDGNILLTAGKSIFIGGVTSSSQNGGRFHNNGSATFLDNRGTGSIFLRNDNVAGSTIRMELTNDGRVGIGTGGTSVSSAAILHLNSNTRGLLLPIIPSKYPTELAVPTPGMIFYSSADSAYKVAVPMLTTNEIVQASNGANGAVGLGLRSCTQAATTYTINQSGTLTQVKFSIASVSNQGSGVAEVLKQDNPAGGTVIGSLSFAAAAGSFSIACNTQIAAGDRITVRFRSFDARFDLSTGTSDASRWRWTNTGDICTTTATTGWERINNNPIALTINMEGATNRQWGNLLTSAGRVGIGTENPRAPLHVTARTNTTNPTGIKFFNSDPNAGFGVVNGWLGEVNAYFDDNVVVSGGIIAAASNIFSDQRIKQIIGRSNAAEDLEKIDRIEITKYRYRDSIHQGSAIQTKVIAQQVRQVVPEAVSFVREFIPNLMLMAEKLEFDQSENLLTISLPKSHTLKTGDRLKCYDEKGAELVLSVVSVPSDNKLIVHVKERPAKLFIYGSEINDFHIVDYDAISMLNVSATQELLRRIKALEKELGELKKK